MSWLLVGRVRCGSQQQDKGTGEAKVVDSSDHKGETGVRAAQSVDHDHNDHSEESDGPNESVE